MSQSFSIPSSSPVLVGGSRSLISGSPAWVACQSFVQSLLFSSPHAVHVGCSAGADQAAVLALGGGSCQARVFACFAPSGAGSWSASAVSSVQRFAHMGGSVSWLAGGSLSVPLVARLMSRSLAALQGCAAAVFFSPGVGSLKVARAALKQGIPVLVCQQGCPVAPVLAVPPVVVSWFGMSFWLYQPAIQSALF